jgi:homoserine O-succinyltransferase
MNNMPDGALEATERQFVALLEQSSAGIWIDLSFYSLTGVPRGRDAAARVGDCYSGTETLWSSGLDALIVTGREPLAPSLPEEPYWESFARVVDWARDNTYATVWSCLAAHAAVLYQDGIQRVKGHRKYCGIFNCAQTVDHALTASLASRVKVPHSRWNGVSEDALSAHGYQVLMRSAEGGVDTFVKQHKSLFVYFQGHPEYESMTLLLEYRRDVARYLRGEAAAYPTLPENYFSPETENELNEFQQRVLAKSESDLAGELSDILARAQIEGAWHATAATVYRNLLHSICDRKAHHSLAASAVLPEDGIGHVIQKRADGGESLTEWNGGLRP